jgi:hypothetical protein
MQQGIFTPMFDEVTLREAEEMAQAHDQALSEGRRGETVSPGLRERELVAEAEERRLAQERRRDMLLVERVFDELPETFGYLRKHAAQRVRDVSQNVFIKGGAAVVLGAERLAVRWAAKVTDEVYRTRMDRKAALSRLGRKRAQRGSDLFANPGVRNPAFEAERYATPEEEVANDLFDQLTAKIHGFFHRPRIWLAKKWLGDVEAPPPDFFETGP